MHQPIQAYAAGASSKSRAFSLTEVMVAMGILSILIVMVGLGVRSVLDVSRRTQCASNIRGNAVTALLYIADNGNRLPYTYSAPTGKSGDYWYEALYAYSAGSDVLVGLGHSRRMEIVGESGMFRCSGNPELPIGYGWSYPNLPYRPAADGSQRPHLAAEHWIYPSRLMIMGCAEKLPGTVAGFIYSPENFPALWEEDFSMAGNIGRGHGDGANFAFLDGHVEWRAFQDIIHSNPESLYFWGVENE